MRHFIFYFEHLINQFGFVCFPPAPCAIAFFLTVLFSIVFYYILFLSFFLMNTDNMQSRLPHRTPCRLRSDAAVYSLFKYFTVGWFAFPCKYISAAAGRICSSFHFRHLIFHSCIELLPLLSQFHPDFGIIPSPLHSQSQASIISSTSLCASLLPIFCVTTRG